MTFDAGSFFATAEVQTLFAPTLSASETAGCTAILDAMAGAERAFTAYALATAYKETAHTMQPIDEIGGNAYFFRRYDPAGPRPDIAKQLGNTQRGDGTLYHGRGYVQLTGRANYAKAARALGEPIDDVPELALRPDIAALVMRRGMTEGWFTGKTFGVYLPGGVPATAVQFTAARRIINGQDCAAEIASYAMQFQSALIKAGA